MEQNKVLNLITAAQSGDDSARDRLLLEYAKLVRAIARSFEVVNAVDYDDLFQVGNIGLLKAISTYQADSGASFKTYASRCIKNAIIDELRKKSPLVTVPIEDENPLIDKLPSPQDPEKDYIDRETVEHVVDAIRTSLTESEFEVFKFYLYGMSYQEISEKLDIEKKKVDNTIYSIKKKAKKLFDR